jgi:cell division transport system permease protein
MKKNESNVVKRRLRSSYFTSILSVALVLFMLGLLGLLILNAKKLSDFVKENIGFSVILNEDVKEADIIRLQKNLDAERYVKSTRYITKEKAAREMEELLGEDFIDFLGYNPLLASIEVQLYAPYANNDSIRVIEEELKDISQIKEVFYQKSLIHLVNENVKKITLIILSFSALLLLISLTLINNTIRLSVYAKRFIIKTMELVGATKGFIRKPFLLRSVIHGFYAAVLANILLGVVIYFAQQEFIEIFSFQDFQMIGYLFLFVLIIGISLNCLSTFFAVNKFLRMHIDRLYY